MYVHQSTPIGEEMEPGIYDIPDAEYFDVEAASNSGLKQMDRSPAHFKHQQDNPKEETPDMRAGKALHAAILEPDEFAKRYIELPQDAPKRPTVAQLKAVKKTDKARFSIEWWTHWDTINADKIILKPEVAAEYLEIGGLIRNHPELAVFFDSGKSEQAVFAIDPQTGVLCKCKPDHMTKVNGHKVVIEVKSTVDARPPAFQRTANNFGYFQAAAFYQDVMQWQIGRPDLYLIVAFERDPPYGIKIYEVPEEDIEQGTRQYRAALNLYAYCMEMGEWPNYDTSIETLEYPRWAKD